MRVDFGGSSPRRNCTLLSAIVFCIRITNVYLFFDTSGCMLWLARRVEARCQDKRMVVSI